MKKNIRLIALITVLITIIGLLLALSGCSNNPVENTSRLPNTATPEAPPTKAEPPDIIISDDSEMGDITDESLVSVSLLVPIEYDTVYDFSEGFAIVVRVD